MIKFEKVSLDQYVKDFVNNTDTSMDVVVNNENIPTYVINEYNNIKLPRRATDGSAGYDFYSPFSFSLAPNESIVIPTGIRVILTTNGLYPFNQASLFLGCYPRSGLGFKYRTTIANTVGIIDEDYCQSDNEGHIKIKLVNCGDKPMSITKGQGFCQGIIQMYFKTDDDIPVSTNRNGGFGSTDNKE